MIVDWYFCNCVGLSPHRAAIFLSVMDVVRHGQDKETIFLAYDELMSASSWEQIYALPHVLYQQQQEDITEAIHATIQNYLECLTVLVADEISYQAIQALIGTTAGDANALLKQLEQSAATVVKPNYPTPSKTPYLDLELFLPETIVLAYLCNAINEHGFTDRFVNFSRSKKLQTVEIIVKEALDGHLGRLAFQLSVRIASSLMGYNADNIREYLLGLENSQFDLEPDLLQTWIDIKFVDNEVRHSRQPVVAAQMMLDESQTLFDYLQNVASIEIEGNTAEKHLRDTVFSRLGRIETSNQKNTLPIILWQLLLWHSAAETAPIIAAETLEHLWQIPKSSASSLSLCRLIEKEEALEQWRKHFDDLSRLSGMSNIHFDQSQEMSVLPISGDAIWACFSPWIRVQSDRFSVAERPGDRYKSAANRPQLIRLMGCTYIATYLLTRLPDGTRLQRTMTELVLHAKNVIDVCFIQQVRYENNLIDSEIKRDKSFYRLIYNQLGMIAFCLAEIDHLGKLESGILSAKTFLTALDPHPDDAYPNPNGDRDLFQRIVVLESLVAWIEDAYREETETTAQESWLSWLDDLYQRVIDAGPLIRERTQELMHLMNRFLRGKTSHHRFTWDQMDKSRAYLLLPQIGAGDWLQSPWGETLNPSGLPLKKIEKNLQIIVAGQRLQALKYDVSLSDTEKFTLEIQWLDDWLDQLVSANDMKDLDRFSCLQLLDLLNHPVIERSEEAQTQIALSILEFGGLYDIDILLKRLFWEDGHSRLLTLASADLIRQTVRNNVLAAIYSSLQADILSSSQERTILFLRKRKQQYRQHKYLQNFIRQIIKVTKGQEDYHTGDLAQRLGERYQDNLYKQFNRRIRSLPIEIRHDGTHHRVQPLINETAKSPRISDWAIVGSSIDPNDLCGILYYNSLRIKNCLNLLDASTHEVDEFVRRKSKQPTTLLGILVSQEANSGKHSYIFACGLPRYLPYSSSQKLNDDTPYFKIDVVYNAEESPGKWIVRGKPIPVFNEWQPGDIERGDIYEGLNAHNVGMLNFRPPYGNSIQGHDLDRSLWDADLSRRFAPFFANSSVEGSVNSVYSIWTTLDAQRRYIPFEHDLNGLLLTGHFYNEASDPIFVLTLIEVRSYNTATGEKIWIWSTRPGENYRLVDNDFMPESLIKIQEKVKEKLKHKQTGLLAVMRVTSDKNQQVRLELVPILSESFKEVIAHFYPELDTALDDRNWRWRDLFDEWNDIVAKRNELLDNQWYVEVPSGRLPAHFPHMIRVDLKASHLLQEAAITVQEWTEWEEYTQTPSIIAIQDTYNMIVPKGQELDFFDDWMSIQKGSRLQIKSISTGIEYGTDGRVWCKTKEDADISVEAESLSMIWGGKRPRLSSWREAEVTENPRWDNIGNIQVADTLSIPSKDNGEFEGIVISIPQDKTDTICQVLWKTHSGVQISQIHIHNLPELRRNKLRVGCRIVGRSAQNQYRLRAESRVIRAQALWQIQQTQTNKVRGLVYLGKVSLNDDMHLIAHDDNGTLMVLSAEFAGTLPGAIFVGDTPSSVSGGINIKERLEYQRPRNTNRTEWGFRVVLNQRGQWITGYCNSLPNNSDLRLTSLWLQIDPRMDGFVSLRRTLHLAPYITETIREDRTYEASRERTERWEAYQAQPYDLSASIFEKYVDLHDIEVPTDTSLMQWSRRVSRVPGEQLFVRGVEYSRTGFVRLRLMKDGSFAASFEDVPPYKLEEYRQELGVMLIPTPDPVSVDLYYAGTLIENDDQFSETTMHRFEWGYGKVLEVPHTQLRIDGQSFTREESLLMAYGDNVSQIEFLEIRSTNSEPVLILNLINVEFSWSQGHKLYHQRTKMRIVHLVHLRYINEELKVTSVEAMNEASIEMAASVSFDNIHSHTRLSERSHRLLLNRCVDHKFENNTTILINGRMDGLQYVKTLGRDIVFDHIYLGFVDNQTVGLSLQQGELIFLQAGDIKAIGNDYGLSVDPHPDLMAEDIDDSFREMLILRRQFSEREDILRRAIRQKKQSEFRGKILVRMKIDDDKPIPTLDNMPPRQITALVRGRTDSVIYAIWLEHFSDRKGNNRIKLEIKPSVRVELNDHDLEDYPSDIQQGAIVRVEFTANKRLKLILASFSDRNYVPESGRIAVILPKNDLLSKRRVSKGARIEDARFWANLRGFTVGGLPNIEAMLGHYSLQYGWNNGSPAEGIELMNHPHPKMGYVGEQKGLYYVSPYIDRKTVGSLVPDQNGLSLYLETLDHERYRLVWRYQSFADVPIRILKKRFYQVRWDYHDKRTGYWVNGKDQPERQVISPHTALSGPLIFEMTAEENHTDWRLRYNSEHFLQFGYPTGQLVNDLLWMRPDETNDHLKSYAVAGVSENQGLWLEMVPGRIAEIPSQLFVRKIARKEDSIAHFAWQLFAPGDEITIGLSRKSLLEVDRFVIEEWRPGLRGMLGYQKALLPVLDKDIESGALTLGSDLFRITLPMETEPASSLVGLYPDNYIDEKPIPKRGDVVLLRLDEREKLIILGVLDYTPTLQKRADWSYDPFGLMVNNTPASHTHLCAVITAVGGSLPVTVEYIDREKKRLFFSMQAQGRSRIGLNQTTLAHILGMLKVQHIYMAVMRAGSQFIILPITELVSGVIAGVEGNQKIEIERQTAVIQDLVAANSPVWIYTDNRGQIHCGLSDRFQETVFDVMARVVVKDSAGNPQGLICENTYNARLFWLPIERLAWTTLTVQEIEQTFIKHREPFQVTLWNKSQISVCDLEQAHKFLNRLRLGDTLQVYVSPKITTDSKRYIVIPNMYPILLTCESENNPLVPGQELAVEIIQITNQNEQIDVKTVPLGKRMYQLALPDWMITSEGMEQLNVRKRIDRYKMWATEVRNLAEYSVKDLVRGEYDTELDSLLCFSYEETQQRRYQEIHLQVTLRWSQQVKSQKELDTTLAIMSLLTLHEYSQLTESEINAIAPSFNFPYRVIQDGWRIQILELVTELGRRALKSQHVEILAKHWLLQNKTNQTATRFWNRLESLRSYIKPNLSREDISQLRQFYRGAVLRGAAQSQIACSLMRAAGQAVEYEPDDWHQSPVVKHLIEVYQSSVAARQTRLHQKHIIVLKTLLEDIMLHNQDNVVLLDPLPTLSESVRLKSK